MLALLIAAAEPVNDSTSELRGWIALGLALIVGGATVAGVVLARRNLATFAKSVQSDRWERKVGTARLVYTEILDRVQVAEGQPLHRFGVNPDIISGLDIYFSAEKPQDERTGLTIQSALEDVVGFRFFVVNNSREPIGETEVRIADLDHKNVSRAPLGLGVLPPDSRREVLWWTPSPWPLPRRSFRLVDSDLMLFFLDSAGYRWLGLGPPRPLRSRMNRGLGTVFETLHYLRSLRAQGTCGVS